MGAGASSQVTPLKALVQNTVLDDFFHIFTILPSFGAPRLFPSFCEVASTCASAGTATARSRSGASTERVGKSRFENYILYILYMDRPIDSCTLSNTFLVGIYFSIYMERIRLVAKEDLHLILSVAIFFGPYVWWMMWRVLQEFTWHPPLYVFPWPVLVLLV